MPDDQTDRGPVVVARLLADIDAGRGARDTIVVPVPTPSTSVVAEVRSTVRDVVERALRPADPFELQLVCSELVSNAIIHGSPPVQLLLHEAADEVVVAVFDRGEAAPALSAIPTTGLRIIDELTNGRWGTTRDGGGKWVWAALPRKEPSG